ncbi:MAG: copper-binding protein [Phycisphaeraceae bacterium]|nr:copper-binding protein [Phycisphaerales bacterium]MCB9842681.1 copper-binding protein [Phycisphaeraceae bacterium]
MSIALWRACCSAALVLCIVVAGCKPSSGSSATADDAVIVNYTVRGQVVEVPVEGDIKSEFRVRHEAIPEYRQAGGKLGMNTMTMPFRLGEGMSLAGVEVGDKVALTFAVEYDPGFAKLRTYYAVKVEELPTDTSLDFTPLPKSE